MKPYWLVSVIVLALLSACAGATSTPINRLTPTVSATPTSTPIATATPAWQVHQSVIEVVTDNAVTGDGGNGWGGHQTRIVHTQNGIFTAYTVEGSGQFGREWRLAERKADGTWPVISHGDAGREPVNLLASPDGTLNIVGWPDGYATLWSGKPENGTLVMTSTRIPNEVQGNWPYGSAGIDKNGDLCVLSSYGGETTGGYFYWACYLPSTGKWITQTNYLDYRYCYTYLFPSADGQLSLVSTRDVRWQALGYHQPALEFDYVFNAFRYWRTTDIASKLIQVLSYADEVPNDQYPDVYLDAQSDAYLDTLGRMHILYAVKGPSTNGATIYRHRIVAPDGSIIYDGEIPLGAGRYNRIFQDAEGRYYLLGSYGLLYPMDEEGETLGKPVRLDLARNGIEYEVEYSGFGLSVPRTGTPLRDVMDVVFPSTNGSLWLYFQLDFSNSSSLPISLVK